MRTKLPITLLLGLIPIFLFTQVVSAQSSFSDIYKVDDRWKTDTTIYSIDISELLASGKRDLIQPLNNPEFVSRNKAIQSYYEFEPVIVLVRDSVAKAYPVNTIAWHEIVNDTIGDLPVAITYCPLCNSSIIFDRRVAHKGRERVLDLYVAGMLRRSNLVMWDKQTESWWQQITGEAVVGELTGTHLRRVEFQMLSVREYFNRYPDGMILSKETGFEKLREQYAINTRFQSYDSRESPFDFFGQKVDPRLPPMERVIDVLYEGTYFNGKYKIYPFSALREGSVINDRAGSKDLVIFYKPGMVSNLDKKNLAESAEVGIVGVFNPQTGDYQLTFRKEGAHYVDEQTGTRWDITGRAVKGPLSGIQLERVRHGHHFAFAWLTFHPDSKIYGIPRKEPN